MFELTEQTSVLTKKYVVKFRYKDNDEIYTQDIKVTPEELERVKTFFARLLDEGYIVVADPNDGNDIDEVVFEPFEYEPLTFAEISQRIEEGDTLVSYAKELGITL
jgi:hypothetical protein